MDAAGGRSAAGRLATGYPLTTLALGHELQHRRGSMQAYGLDPAGAVLVRPDGYVAWRAEAAADQPIVQLSAALDRTLGRARSASLLAA